MGLIFTNLRIPDPPPPPNPDPRISERKRLKAILQHLPNNYKQKSVNFDTCVSYKKKKKKKKMRFRIVYYLLQTTHVICLPSTYGGQGREPQLPTVK